MRPHVVTSISTSSFTRLTNHNSARTLTSSSILTTRNLASNSNRKLFTTGTAHRPSLVKPQAYTTAFYHPSQNTKSFSSTATMSTPSASVLLDLFKARRSYYQLNKTLPISKDRVQEIVKESLSQIPSSFNSQSNRVVVLFGADHDKLWDFTSEVLKAIVPADSWQHTADRISGFKAGAATVSFFFPFPEAPLQPPHSYSPFFLPLVPRRQENKNQHRRKKKKKGRV